DHSPAWLAFPCSYDAITVFSGKHGFLALGSDPLQIEVQKVTFALQCGDGNGIAIRPGAFEFFLQQQLAVEIVELNRTVFLFFNREYAWAFATNGRCFK